MTLSDSETIALRVTVIGGQRYADDYQVIRRGLPIVGRIMKRDGVWVTALPLLFRLKILIA
jgi:hypothetical protein